MTRPAGPTRLTIAVPTYNRHDHLRALVPQLLGQLDALTADPDTTGLETALLVIDNDPSGSGHAVIETMSDPRLRSMVEPRPGVAATRNRALTETGEDGLLVFIDDDERPGPDWLRQLVHTWLAHRPAAVAGPVVSLFPEGADPWVQAGGFFDRRHRFGLRTGDPINEAATNNLLLDCRQVGELRFDLRFGQSGGEDSMFTRRLHAAGGTLLWCAEAVVTEEVPWARLDRRWLRRRALSNGNSEARVGLAMADASGGAAAGPFRDLAVRAQCLARGLPRVAGGLVRWVVPGSLDRRARAVRTVYRGVGLLAGGLGFAYLEYERGPRRWHWGRPAAGRSDDR